MLLPFRVFRLGSLQLFEFRDFVLELGHRSDTIISILRRFHEEVEELALGLCGGDGRIRNSIKLGCRSKVLTSCGRTDHLNVIILRRQCDCGQTDRTVISLIIDDHAVIITANTRNVATHIDPLPEESIGQIVVRGSAHFVRHFAAVQIELRSKISNEDKPFGWLAFKQFKRIGFKV